MNNAIKFKALQRRLKFRNPNHWIELPDGVSFTALELDLASQYLETLTAKKINFTFPGHEDYPLPFYSMKEPPLFLEYIGKPLWKEFRFISIIGSRDMAIVSDKWLKNHLTAFLELGHIGVVSGGAKGIDQLAHLIAMKCIRPTVMVLPSGLHELYPANISELARLGCSDLVCLLSEFEAHQKIHKSHFYFRNRLIAALGQFTLVVQASLKSGSLLTVHHCLENGKPVSVVPAHPELIGFDGSLKLLKDGAFPATNFQDLLDFWNAEIQSK